MGYDCCDSPRPLYHRGRTLPARSSSVMRSMIISTAITHRTSKPLRMQPGAVPYHDTYLTRDFETADGQTYDQILLYNNDYYMAKKSFILKNVMH